MKKMICLLLVMMMAISFAACKAKESKGKELKDAVPSVEITTEVPTEETQATVAEEEVENDISVYGVPFDFSMTFGELREACGFSVRTPEGKTISSVEPQVGVQVISNKNGKTCHFWIENKTDKKCSVDDCNIISFSSENQSSAICVNGVSTTDETHRGEISAILKDVEISETDYGWKFECSDGNTVIKGSVSDVNDSLYYLFIESKEV